MRWTHISWKLYGPWVGGAYLAWLLGSAVSQAGGTGVPGNSSPPPNFSCLCSASRYPTGSCCIAHEILVSSSQVVFLNLTVFPPCLLFLVSGSFPFFLVSKRGRFCLCRSCRLSTLTEKKKMSKQMIYRPNIFLKRTSCLIFVIKDEPISWCQKHGCWSGPSAWPC